MTTKADQEFTRGLYEDMAKIGPVESVYDYRRMLHVLLEDRKNREPLPKIGRYLPEERINDDLTAAIAIPDSSAKKPFPVCLHCHGHGGLAGDARSYRRLTYDWAAAGYLTVTPDYRKAPEHRFPVGLNDLMDTALWLKDNAARYGGDGSQIVICGDAVGGAFALTVVLRLLETPQPPRIRAFVGLEAHNFNASNHDKGAPMAFLMDAFMPEGYAPEDLNHPWLNPGRAIQPGQALPPILLITGSSDFAAPDTLAFAMDLFAKQIPFQLHVIEGMPHDFTKFPDMDGYKEAHRLTFDFLAAHP